MTPPILNPTEFITFTLVLVRVSILLFLAPIFGSEALPAQVKIGLGLISAVLLSSVVHVDPAVFPKDIYEYVPLLIREVFIGLALALMVRLVFEGVQFAGQFIGYQMGFAIVNVMDPQSGGQTSVLSQFFYILALLAFLSANGHHLIIEALAESFTLAPPGGHTSTAMILRFVTVDVGRMFSIAIKIGAPALAILFVTKVGMGIVAKMVPQLNVLFVGMPLYIIIGLFIFGLSLSFFIPILGRAVAESHQSVINLLKTL